MGQYQERMKSLYYAFENLRVSAIAEAKRRKHPRFAKSKQWWMGLAQGYANARAILSGEVSLANQEPEQPTPPAGGEHGG